MYFYCDSYGEYEMYTERVFYHEKKFTEKEFQTMINTTKSHEKLCEKYGFKKVEYEVHLFYK